MKQLRFLGCKLGFDVGFILVDLGMVVMLDPSLEFRWMACKGTYERDAFSGDVLSAREIRRRQTSRMTLARRILKTMESVNPIAMAIGMLACQPADEIASLVTANWGIGAPTPSFLLGVGKFTYASHAHSLVANYYTWPFSQVLWFVISYTPCFRPCTAVPYTSPSPTPRHYASPFPLPS